MRLARDADAWGAQPRAFHDEESPYERAKDGTKGVSRDHQTHTVIIDNGY
jgi:hypothetical protein